tara:strand:+ start:362 stop:538 length:177 start_codon:yes stop_codon:yes gene_type:complete
MAYPTNPIYKFYKSQMTGGTCIMTVKGLHTINIPLDEANTDYQEYLEWAKTNTAEAAD